MSEQYLKNNSPIEGKDYFFRGHPLTSIQVKFSLKARFKMFLMWKEAAAKAKTFPGSVIDMGTTPDMERLDSNCHLPWLLEAGVKLSLCSIEDVSKIAERLPGTRLVPLSPNDNIIGVKNGSYDWAISFATLEHVGSRQRQVSFIRELGRVANSIFLTTPNRYHWLEFHTKLPFLHWLPRPWHRKILQVVGLKMWASEEQLRLVSNRELIKTASEALGSDFQIQTRTVWALGMASNLVLVAQRKK